ncbi:hypothetical protein KR222_008662, partial [Zaprionus bogoriensis]
RAWTHPRFMFVFEHGDLNTAAHYLAERMQEPFEPLTVACVAVQQSVRDDFIERVRNKFHQLKPNVAIHPHFQRTFHELKTGGVSYVVAPEANAPPFASPILVTDNVTQFSFSSSPSGVVILRSFEELYEAADAFNREIIAFDAVIVFDERIAVVYELAAHVNCNVFYVNCADVCTVPILPYYGVRQEHALLLNGYHFETLQMNKSWKIIVFPYKTTLPRPCVCPPGRCSC